VDWAQDSGLANLEGKFNLRITETSRVVDNLTYVQETVHILKEVGKLGLESTWRKWSGHEQVNYQNRFND
jgi:hypothetical protein